MFWCRRMVTSTFWPSTTWKRLGCWNLRAPWETTTLQSEKPWSSGWRTPMNRFVYLFFVICLLALSVVCCSWFWVDLSVEPQRHLVCVQRLRSSERSSHSAAGTTRLEEHWGGAEDVTWSSLWGKTAASRRPSQETYVMSNVIIHSAYTRGLCFADDFLQHFSSEFLPSLDCNNIFTLHLNKSDILSTADSSWTK